MKIDAHTKICGLIGYPVGHSVSPVIHNGLAEIYGQNLVYVPLQVAPGKLASAIAGADSFDFLGMNVTVPYKSDVMEFCRALDPLAEKIGAVNTLVRTEEGYKGFNTDMPGLYRAMLSDGIVIEGQDVLILGAGGVARAVAVLLAEKKAGSITILNRTLEKAEKIAAEVNEYAGRKLVCAMTLEDYPLLPQGKTYLAIQATNVGMFPKVDDVVIAEKAFYDKIHTGYDLIFNPLHTQFMQCVENAGGKAYNGLKMLLYQGIIAYELWNQVEISEQDAEHIFTKMKEALGA